MVTTIVTASHKSNLDFTGSVRPFFKSVVVVAQGITGVNIERGLKASNEGQSTHHMGGATGSFSVRFHIMMSYGLPSL